MKVFFRAGVLGRLEDDRDRRLAEILTKLQAQMRGAQMRKTYRRLLDQRLAIVVIQRNARKHVFLRSWPWWKLYTKVKPLLNVSRQEDEIRQREEEVSVLLLVPPPPPPSPLSLSLSLSSLPLTTTAFSFFTGAHHPQHFGSRFFIVCIIMPSFFFPWQLNKLVDKVKKMEGSEKELMDKQAFLMAEKQQLYQDLQRVSK